MIEKRMTRSGEARYDVRVRGTDGKERSRTFRTRKEAERFERAHHTAMDRGVWVDPRAGRVTLTAWATEWQRTVVHLGPKTLKAHDVNLRNHILPPLGEYELAKLTPSLLRAWLSDLSAKQGRGQRKIAAGTVAQAYRTLNRVLSAAVQDELIGRNPLQGVKPPKAAPEPMRFLTPDEVATLADTIDGRYRAFVFVAAYSGLRAGELIALRRSNANVLRRTITVIEQVQYIDGRYVVASPKSTAGRRSVAVPRVVAEELEKHLLGLADHRVDALVFPAPEGGFLHLDNFRKRVWNPAVAAAGLSPLRIHDMRHTCASLAIAAGADVKVLQRMLGHSSAALTLDRYGHLMPGQAESVADSLDVLARAATSAATGAVITLPGAASNRA